MILDSNNKIIEGGMIKLGKERNINLDKKGKFSFTIDLFKKGGGEKESERLGVPLLGKIPLSEEITHSTDKGDPITFSSPDHPHSKEFFNITKKIIDQLSD